MNSKEKIVLLGASGYIGHAFLEALERRNQHVITLSRNQVDYTRFEPMLHFLQETKPDFLINAAGYTGKPNVDACELAKAETLAGNTLFPQALAHACLLSRTAWGHVSSGCIYSGAKVGNTIERDLSQPALKNLAEKNPSAIRGFTEDDEPNFTFRRPPCSFYSGTKALAEEVIHGVGQNYIWRLRIPFDEWENLRNYLVKVQRYAKVYDNVNSISHRGDFVNACLELRQRRAPFGIYNITNPGFVTTRQVVEMIKKIQHPAREFEFWQSDEEFYREAAKTPRSNCVLDVSKLLGTGIAMAPVQEALEKALRSWRRETRS